MLAIGPSRSISPLYYLLERFCQVICTLAHTRGYILPSVTSRKAFYHNRMKTLGRGQRAERRSCSSVVQRRKNLEIFLGVLQWLSYIIFEKNHVLIFACNLPFNIGSVMVHCFPLRV